MPVPIDSTLTGRFFLYKYRPNKVIFHILERPKINCDPIGNFKKNPLTKRQADQITSFRYRENNPALSLNSTIFPQYQTYHIPNQTASKYPPV